jgi:hypothetical protein
MIDTLMTRPREPDARARKFGSSLARASGSVGMALAVLFALPAVGRAQQVAVAWVQPANVWPDEQFEQWVFQQSGGVAGARKRFDAQLTLQVEEIDRACKLSDEQKKKLRLMARADVKRFFDGYDRAKRKFNALHNDVQKLQEVMPDVQPLMAAVNGGLFGRDSLFGKSLRHTLSGEQAAAYEALLRQRAEAHHRARIELVVGMIDQTAPLRDDQRKQLIDLFMKEVKPLRVTGQYDYYVTMAQIGRLPEEKVKALLTDTQWKPFSKQLAQYKGIVPALRQQGMAVDDDDLEPADAKKK